jgi:hypothetical protein
MNKYVSRGLWTVLVTGGFMALGVGVAHADTGTSGTDGIASGTQGILGIEIPAQLGGNAISVLGDADSSGASTSAPAADASSGPGGTTSGTDSVAGGTQLLPDLGVPVTLGGNAISVLGDASSNGAATTPASGSDDAGASSGTTDGTDGTLSGTQVLGDVGAPVTLGGNAISVLGDASSSDAGTASGSADAGDQEGSTSGTDGMLGGSQVLADVGVPVTLGGNAISLLGDASSEGSATVPTGSDDADAPSGTTDGTDGTVAGTQVLGDVGVPVTLGGNAISVLGDASTEGSGTSAGSGDTAGGDATTDGSDGILGGSQVPIGADAPVTLGGNAVSVLGDASSDGADSASGSTAGDASGSTDGADGTLGGTQVLTDLGVPVTLGGNAISVLGDASTDGPSTDAVDPGTDPGDDPGTDPGDDGGDLPTYALAADDVTALAATGVEGGLTALGLAVLLLAVGGVMVRRMAVRRR